MSETEISVPMDDKALFDAATSDAAPETPAVEQQPTEQAAPQDAGPARDEHGRFAPKTEQQAPAEAAQTEQAQQPENSAQIPAWRVAEIAAARREAEAKATELEQRARVLEQQNRQFQQQLRQYTEKPKEAPDPFVDHAAAVRHTMEPEVNEMRQALLYNSQLIAQQVHGADKVKAADEAFTRAYESGQIDPGDYNRVIRSPNIFDAAVKWHARQQTMSTIGDKDPTTWAMSQIGEWAKDPAKRDAIMSALGQAPAQQNGQGAPTNSIVKLPPSLTRASGTSGQAETGSFADGDLYAFATR